jgi:hypothetical protein
MAAPLSKRERNIGYGILIFTVAAFLALWTPVVIGKVKVPKKTPFVDQPVFAVTLGIVMMAFVAYFIWRDRRRIAGAFAMLVALGGWGNLVLLAFPILAWGVFVGFKLDKAEIEARRAAREAKRAAKGKASKPATGDSRPIPPQSKRYTPPKRRSKSSKRD